MNNVDAYSTDDNENNEKMQCSEVVSDTVDGFFSTRNKSGTKEEQNNNNNNNIETFKHTGFVHIFYFKNGNPGICLCMLIILVFLNFTETYLRLFRKN